MNILSVIKTVLTPALVLAMLTVEANELRVTTRAGSDADNAVFAKIIEAFERNYPMFTVQWNKVARERYPTEMEALVRDAKADVLSGVAGNRLLDLVNQDLLAPLALSEKLQAKLSLVETMVKSDETWWALPSNFYPWGLLIRRDVLEKYGVSTPGNWEQLLASCRALVANNQVPIALGSQYLWTLAAWFDYINLRINGLAFHRLLAQGEVSWEDPRIRAVFGLWGQAINAGCFNRNHSEITWNVAAQNLGAGKAAMQLIGSFAAHPLLESDPTLESSLAVVAFPEITPGLSSAMVSPVDSYMVPKNAANLEGAMLFIEFLGLANNQQALATVRRQWPVVQKANHDTQALNGFEQSVESLLYAADPHVQFFDREFPDEIAKVAMVGFQVFMQDPDQIESVLGDIEAARQAHYQ